MTEKFKILTSYIKDMSSETPDIETFLFVKENISKYQLNIGITSKALKNKLIEINTNLKFEDKETNIKKSHNISKSISSTSGVSKNSWCVSSLSIHETLVSFPIKAKKPCSFMRRMPISKLKSL